MHACEAVGHDWAAQLALGHSHGSNMRSCCGAAPVPAYWQLWQCCSAAMPAIELQLVPSARMPWPFGPPWPGETPQAQHASRSWPQPHAVNGGCQ